MFTRLLPILLLLFACEGPEKKSIGTIERIDPAINQLIDPAASVEIIAEGFDWTEGPVWLEKDKKLLFSDIPPNKIYQWTEDSGARLYLEPSGYTGTVARAGEKGSNALLMNSSGQLVLCQHGDRRIALMDAPMQHPQPRFITLADNYEGKRLNSPNDIAERSNGDLFFTDPPYGLEKQAEDPDREMNIQGVFRIAGGKLSLLVDSITRPNGIAFLPGEKTIIIANSDPDKAVWYLYDLDANDSLVNGRIMKDVTAESKGLKGLPDGLKVDKKGNIFATGPGGVYIFNSSHKLLGKIRVPEACSNVALADDDRTLFITADMYVLRLKMWGKE